MGVTRSLPRTSSFGETCFPRGHGERLVQAPCLPVCARPSSAFCDTGILKTYEDSPKEGFRNGAMSWRNVSLATLADNRLVIKDCIADAFHKKYITDSRKYSVIATLNLNGDYVSDQLAAMVGPASALLGSK